MFIIESPDDLENINRPSIDSQPEGFFIDSSESDQEVVDTKVVEKVDES